LTTSFRNKEPQATQTRDAIQNHPKVEEGKFEYPLQGMGRGISENHRRKGQRTNTLIPRSERKTKRRSRK
jgi:hypothetical protein